LKVCATYILYLRSTIPRVFESDRLSTDSFTADFDFKMVTGEESVDDEACLQ